MFSEPQTTLVGRVSTFSELRTTIKKLPSKFRKLGAAFANDVLATEVSNQEVTTVDDDDESGSEQNRFEQVHVAEGDQDVATEHDAEDGMDDGDEQGETEEDTDLPEEGAVEHFFAGADFTEHVELLAVVGAFGKLL